MKNTPVMLILGLLAISQLGCEDDTKQSARAFAQGDPDRGALVIESYGCASCHTIPGINGATGLVGPPLTQMGSRSYIAGIMSNNPDNLIAWLKDPPGIDPKTAMPNLHINDSDARDIAAYLYALQ